MKKAKTKRMDNDGNARPQGYRIYEITGDVPALSANGGGNSLTKKHCWDMVKVISHNGHKNKDAVIGEIVPTLKAESHGHTPMVQVKSATASGYEEAKEGDSINYSLPNSKTRRGRVGVGVAQTLDTQVNQGVLVGKVSRSEEGKKLRKESMKAGKDYTPFQAKQIQFENKDEINTITCATQKDNMLLQGFRIRRLTEIECERLQGFPDNWTKYGNYNGVIKEISRTQRYKMCGNAVTVDIVKMIGVKLLNSLVEKNI